MARVFNLVMRSITIKGGAVHCYDNYRIHNTGAELLIPRNVIDVFEHLD